MTTVKEEAQKLHDEGVDIIIVLSHSGFGVDRKIAKDGGPYIDLIVGGHTHTFLYNGEPPSPDVPEDAYPAVEVQEDGRKIYIVQASAFSKYVGDLTVWFDAAGVIQKTEGNPIYLSNDVIPGNSDSLISLILSLKKSSSDPTIVEELKPWKEAVDAVAMTVHGYSTVLLEQPSCIKGECNIGNLVTDSYVHHFIDKAAEDEWTYASIAIQQAGGIRTSLSKGSK